MVKPWLAKEELITIVLASVPVNRIEWTASFPMINPATARKMPDTGRKIISAFNASPQMLQITMGGSMSVRLTVINDLEVLSGFFKRFLRKDPARKGRIMTS